MKTRKTTIAVVTMTLTAAIRATIAQMVIKFPSDCNKLALYEIRMSTQLKLFESKTLTTI